MTPIRSRPPITTIMAPMMTTTTTMIDGLVHLLPCLELFYPCASVCIRGKFLFLEGVLLIKA